MRLLGFSQLVEGGVRRRSSKDFGRGKNSHITRTLDQPKFHRSFHKLKLRFPRIISHHSQSANISESVIIHSSTAADKDSAKVSATFTGDVWHDPIHTAEDARLSHVMFTPGARTYWHTHEKGQMIKVMAGSGWICDKESKAQRSEVGDVLWCQAGVTHWHGVDDGTFMMHFVCGLGKINWLDPVTDEEYAKK